MLSVMKVWYKYVLNLNCTVTILKMKLLKLEDRILVLETEISDMKKSATCHLKQSYYKYFKENETSTWESSGKKKKILVKVDVLKHIEGTTQKIGAPRYRRYYPENHRIGAPSTKDDIPDIINRER